jgi:predicted nucleotidyltransferase
MAISDRFSTLIERIAPSPAEVSAYATHLRTIGSAVESALSINKTERIGSFTRGTAVRSISDLDLMVVLSSNERKWGRGMTTSTTTLNKVKEALVARFTTTSIRNSGSAVVLLFAGGRRPVDVVPAFYAGPYKGRFTQYQNYPTYTIPDASGGWLLTSPQIHGVALAREDERSGYKLKRVASLAKYWAAVRTHLNLHSFHVEILIASTQISIGPGSYAQVLHELFRNLASRNGHGIRDPLELSGVIPASSGAAAAERLAAAARTAAEHSERALQAEAQRDTPEAVRQWKIVFGRNFPS